MYRIQAPTSLKRWSAESSGCIRMTNDDVIDLYSRVRVGTIVSTSPPPPPRRQRSTRRRSRRCGGIAKTASARQPLAGEIVEIFLPIGSPVSAKREQ